MQVTAGATRDADLATPDAPAFKVALQFAVKAKIGDDAGV
jgi:hypothetical protein